MLGLASYLAAEETGLQRRGPKLDIKTAAGVTIENSPFAHNAYSERDWCVPAQGGRLAGLLGKGGAEV